MTRGGRDPVLILNPRAGGLRNAQEADRVATAAGNIFGTRALRTRESAHARELGRAARLNRAPEVVVAGGDGTVHQVVQGFFDVGPARGGPEPPLPTLTLLPLGTGNDLARCLGVPLDWEEALARARNPTRIRRLDLMETEVDGERCMAVNAVILGSGGRVGALLTSEEKDRWGPLAYLRSGAEVVLDLQPLRVSLSIDGAAPETLEVLNVVAGNGRYAGGGIPIAPGSIPWDGAMDLVVVGSVGTPAVLAMAGAILREEDPEHEAYRHVQVREMTVEAAAGEKLPVSVDGENARARRVSVALRPGLLPIRIPGGEE